MTSGPFFDDLEVGYVERGAPDLTLTAGHAAAHQAILAGRLRLALAAPLARRVLGSDRLLAHPSLVCDAVLRIVTVDQESRPVLDFTRCAMLPLSDPGRVTDHADPIEGEPRRERRRCRQLGARARSPDAQRRDGHHDARFGQGGRRLVYGGHTIGIAAGQLTRALPNLATIVAWHSCDHVAPVFEGDALTSTVELERAEALPQGEASYTCGRGSAPTEVPRTAPSTSWTGGSWPSVADGSARPNAPWAARASRRSAS